MTTSKQQKKIEIYTTKVCPYCRKAKALLDKKELAYEEISVDSDTEREKMIERTGGVRSVPQIFVDGALLPGGCDGLYDKEEKGELNKFLYF